ncbi:MAG: polysaccharide biosynthesis tyrosine autokinase, partial [Limisphaerales bacterium]
MSKLLPPPQGGPARYRSPVADRVNLVAFLRRSLRMFRRRWWIALVTLVIGVGIGVYLAMTQPDMYTAMSQLSVAPKVAFSQRTGDRAIITEEKQNYAQAQMEYMRGVALLAKVEEKVQELRNPDGTVPTKVLFVEQGAGSTFILKVNSTSLDYARRFARAWAQEFRLFKEDMLSEVARKQIDRTRYDLSRQEEQVKEARVILDEFLKVHQIATSQDTGNAAQELLDNLQRRRQSVELERQRLEAKTAEELADEKVAAQGAGAGAGAGVGTSLGAAGTAEAAAAEPTDPLEKFMGRSTYRDLRLRLRRVEAELERQAPILKPLHPHMVNLARVREDLQREMREQLALIDEIRRAQIASMKLEESVLDEQIKREVDNVFRLREISREFARLSENYAGHKRQLDELNRDLLALSKLQSSDEDFTILEEGVGPAAPIGPNRARTVIIGVAAGLLVGLALIFLLHKLDDRVESAEDLEKALEEPILGQIPIVSRRDAKDGVISVDRLSPNNIFVEAFRGVRSSVMFGDLGGPKQVMMATSSVPGDGKTTFTVNFAITLAKAGNRVLLVDADLRRGTVADYFNLASEPGLSDVLSGHEAWPDVLNATAHPTLLVITQGREIPNPGELLLSKVFSRFIEQARREFDYIIFDSPPVIGMDDAASLASNCDGLVFVYRVGSTSLRLAKLAVNTTRQRGGHILGLILNGVTVGSPDYYYTAYYYSHYAYSGGRRRKAVGEGGDGAAQRPGGARLLDGMREGREADTTETRNAE